MTVSSTESASRTMAAQSAALQASVAAVALRQGTADEARALVQRARERITEVGWQRAADEFNAPDGPYIDRDLYLFALDADGRYLVCGANPRRVGCLLHDARGVSVQVSEQFLADGQAAAAAGGGWIEYEFNGVDGREDRQSKSAWVCDLGDGAFMGCGVIRQSGGAATATLPAEAPVELLPA